MKRTGICVLITTLFVCVLYFATFTTRNKTPAAALVFLTNSPPILPHAIGGGISAEIGSYRWNDIVGCFPFAFPLDGCPQFLVFVHQTQNGANHGYEFVCVATNNSVFIVSEVIKGPIMGFCPGFVTAKAHFDSNGLTYVESDLRMQLRYSARLRATNSPSSNP